MRYFYRLLLLICLLSGTVTAQKNYDFVDMGRNISAASESQIEERLKLIYDKGNGEKIIMVNLEVPMSIGLINKKVEAWKQAYDLVLVVGKEKGTKHFEVLAEINPQKKNSRFLQVGAVAFETAFSKECNKCRKYSPGKRAALFKLTADAMVQLDMAARAITATGAINTRTQVRPFLPLTKAVENEVKAFGASINGRLKTWEDARVIHIDRSSAADLTHDTYISKVQDFGAKVKQDAEDFYSKVKAGSYRGMYLDGIGKRIVTQPVHFNAVGRLTGNPIYYEAAIKRMRVELASGKTMAALEEYAAFENRYAWHELYSLYRWLDKEEWLSFDQGAGATTGDSKQKRRDVHKYKFNTLQDKEFPGPGINVGFANLGANVKFETFLIAYTHAYKPWKYKMYLTCISDVFKADLGFSVPGTDYINFFGDQTLPQGENVNNSARNHPYHFSPAFWRSDIIYDYTGASTSGSGSTGTKTTVIAGKMTFTSGDRAIAVDAAGENHTINKVNTAGFSIMESAAGVGLCRGFGVTDMVGISKNLASVSGVAPYQGDLVSFKRLLLSFSTGQKSLSSSQQGHLNEVVADVIALRDEFEGKKAEIVVHGVAGGLWSANTVPSQLNDNSGLSGADLASYNSYQTVKAKASQVALYLKTALGNAGVPSSQYSIDAERKFFIPSSYNRYVTDKMGKNYDLAINPNGWRSVIVTVSARE